ncbi:transferrin receptor protein 2-like, partial [Polymixia lowei]
MDSIRTPLRQLMGVAEGGEGGGAQRVEMRFIQSEAEDDLEAGPNSDITALLLQYRHGYQRAALCLCLSGLVIFAIAFVLGYAVFRGQYHWSVQAGEQENTEGLNHSAEKGVGLYLGQLRDMLRTYLQDEDIENTVSIVGRRSHPPGSPEGTSLASEILQRFQDLDMDHTWTDSHYATLQFPHKTQQNSLWLVNSSDDILEQIPLNPLDYCPYSATGNTT